MKDSRGGTNSRVSLCISATAAAVGTLAALVACVVGERAGLIPHVLLLLALLFVLAFGALRLYARIACRVEEVAAALRRVIEGRDRGSLSVKQERAVEGFGPGMLDSLRELETSIDALRQDKLRAETVLSNMADGIIAVDSDLRVTLLNSAAATILDDRDHRILRKRLEDLELHPEITRLAADCVAFRKAQSSEIRLPGLAEKTISILATPVRTSRAGGDSAVIILRDLSDLRRHEKSQKEFVGNVSHELRTPITAVKVTTEALLAGAKNDEALLDRFLNSIASEADRLSALINDLLELAKRDSGISRTDRTTVSVADLVERAVKVVIPQARQNEVTLEVDVPRGLSGYCDEMQMIQVVRNLVDNAVKYTPAGGRVDVSARSLGGDLVIEVRDTGIGIPQGEIDRVFERFYRVDKARSRQLGGTGLGLAIVKEIVDAHGGRISVKAELGKGSEFSVVLPANLP